MIGLAEDRDEVLCLFHVVWCKERVGCPSFLAASSTANAVNVVLRIVGVVIVNDKFDILNICLKQTDAPWQEQRRAERHAATAARKDMLAREAMNCGTSTYHAEERIVNIRVIRKAGRPNDKKIVPFKVYSRYKCVRNSSTFLKRQTAASCQDSTCSQKRGRLRA